MSTKWRKYSINKHVPIFSYMKNTSKHMLLVFSPFNAHFYPPLHHNGKGSIGAEFDP